MKLKNVKKGRYIKSWKSKLGFLARQGLKNGVALPLVWECDTLEELEAYYSSVKNSSFTDDMMAARLMEDIYNYGEFYILKEDVDIEDISRIFIKEV